MADIPYRFEDHPGKDPAESIPIELDWFSYCANFWRANEVVTSSEFVRPNTRRATGFSYEATAAGTTSNREPVWPTIIGLMVVDGSVTWTCRAAGTNGLNVLSAPSAVSEPTGLTISSISAAENTKVRATYVGGTLDQDYDAVFTVIINGVPRVGRQRVMVRKR